MAAHDVPAGTLIICFDLPPEAPDRPVSRVASSRPPQKGDDGLLRFPPPRLKYAYHDDRAQARR